MKRGKILKGTSAWGHTRRMNIRPERDTFLILTNGKNTEPSYFSKFRLSNITLKWRPLDPLRLVKHAVAMDALNKFDHVWVVFDKDEFTDENFNEAINMARKSGIKVAYSNQAFEYWLLLHFEALNGERMDRRHYGVKINNLLSKYNLEYPFDSSKLISNNFFDVLISSEPVTGRKRVDLAIERAGKIYDRLDHHSPAKEESSTTVHLLVQELLVYFNADIVF